jgi:hydroxymethylpyrimidine pyrophosphatase-like HAD family hydrolase
MKKLVVFDLDGTLAQSKASIDSGMAELFGNRRGRGLRALVMDMVEAPIVSL